MIRFVGSSLKINGKKLGKFKKITKLKWIQKKRNSKTQTSLMVLIKKVYYRMPEDRGYNI